MASSSSSKKKGPPGSFVEQHENVTAKLKELKEASTAYEAAKPTERKEKYNAVKKIFDDLSEIIHTTTENELDDDMHMLMGAPFWGLEWPVSDFPLKIVLTYEEVRVLRIQNEITDTRLTDVEDQSAMQLKRIEALERAVGIASESASILELGQVAFDFEKMALEATGGDYASGYNHPATKQKVYDSTFKKLAKDYRKKKMEKDNLENLDKFLKRIAPDWVGTQHDLVIQLDAAITDMKDARLSHGHPDVNPANHEKLAGLVRDKVAFGYMWNHLKTNRYGS